MSPSTSPAVEGRRAGHDTDTDEVVGGTWQGNSLAPSVEGRWNIQVVVEETQSAVVVPLTLQARLPAVR